MKRVGVVQARLGSSRLPRKALADVDGRPMIAHELDRLRRCWTLDEVVVATTDRAEDDELAHLVANEGGHVFRGSDSDVLARVLSAAERQGADVVVRVTGDCPLIDPEVVDLVVDRLGDDPSRLDYASNVLRRTYPRGLDVEAMFVGALRQADRASRSPEEREHVTLAMRGLATPTFRTVSVEDQSDNSDLRLTVDEPADLDLIRAIFASLGSDDSIWSYRTIVAFLRSHPEVRALNAGVETWTPATLPGELVPGDRS